MDARRNNPTEATADREIVITRVVDAPRERVFEAMTDPKQVVRWWGPRGFTTTIEREMVTTRIFDAPRPLVFKAWTDRIET